MCCPNRATPARPGYPARGRTGLPPHHLPAPSQLTFLIRSGQRAGAGGPAPQTTTELRTPPGEPSQPYRGGPAPSTAIIAQAGSSYGRTERQTPHTGTELSMLSPGTPQQPLPRSLSPQAREGAARQSDLSFLGQQL